MRFVRDIVVDMRIVVIAAVFLATIFLFTQHSQPLVFADSSIAEPWQRSELMRPPDLAESLKTSKRPNILFVGFPVLYRNKHIAHALMAGPGNKPEGLDTLAEEAASLPKDKPVVIYCGCCPFDKCPNVRPAYLHLKKLGFNQVRVLYLATNFHDDWSVKGYSTELGHIDTHPPRELK